jgi:hypothetical protein
VSDVLHRRIKEAQRVNGDLYRLMNSRSGEWGLVNGQLVRYGRNGDDRLIAKFERMTFRFGDPMAPRKEGR